MQDRMDHIKGSPGRLALPRVCHGVCRVRVAAREAPSAPGYLPVSHGAGGAPERVFSMSVLRPNQGSRERGRDGHNG